MGRWLEVLTAFLRQDVWGVRELSAETGLPRSAVHRMLTEMKRLGLLTGGPDGQVEVGPVLTRLAIVLANRLDVGRIARPVLEETMRRTNETTILALYAPIRRQAWAVDAVESAHPVRYVWDSLATWRDLHVGATGKGILAFLPTLEQRSILDELFRNDGAASGTRAGLERQLQEARRQGYVISRGESFQGAIAVASPIRDAKGTVVGDLVVSWPDSRTGGAREQQIGSVVFEAATQVSRGLGFLGDIRSGG